MTALPGSVAPERGSSRPGDGTAGRHRPSADSSDLRHGRARSQGGPLLEVTDLEVSIATEGGLIEAVRGITFSLGAGETLGVVGESGSGKTMLSLAILGLLPNAARVAGSVRLEGRELLTASAHEWNAVRGARVAMIFQDPMTALNPMYNIGWQVAEGLRLHTGLDRTACQRRAVELLDMVGLPQPEQLARRYPHELSGGMRQRVVIAIAIANEPDLLIADEPTTALDVTVQAQILDTLRSIRHKTKSAMILISHDLGVVAGVADRVLVMYAGKAVEVGEVEDIFRAPRMPYTIGLLASLPSIDERRGRLPSIPGTPPSGTGYGRGCAFAPRCPISAPQCLTEPALVAVGPAHTAACVFAAEAGSVADVGHEVLERLVWSDSIAGPGEPTGQAPAGGTAGSAEPAGQAPAGGLDEPARHADTGGADGVGDVVITVENLTKHFVIRGEKLRSRLTLEAVNGVNLELRAGKCLAVVGESGCGKSTLARLLLRLEEPTAGSIVMNGRDITTLDDKALRSTRRDIQMVFQDPYASLNPRLSVGEIVAEPLIVHKIPDRANRVRALLSSVGLDPAAGVRFPGEFSGGQRQRIGIARALALEPTTLVLDEPVSALDVSIQASVLNLLRDLQRERNMSYLLIAHDLAVVRQIAHEVAVMYLGTIVEQGPADLIYRRPAHPYATALLSAVPIPDPARERTRQRILLKGEVPSPVNPPSGCRFRTRCWKADDRCAEEVPPLRFVEGGHRVACHYPENGPWAEADQVPERVGATREDLE
jgi:peptide/nickel transport system ATP-binding protein